MAEGIKSFLISVGLERHFDMFVTRGFDEESDIQHLNITDLNCVGISDPADVVKILKAAMSYHVTTEYGVFCWLRENGLTHYWEGFVQSELTELSQVAQLNLPDEDLYDELEITLPGHKRRLERAVCALRKRQRQTSPPDSAVVTEGWWGNPEYLHNAKYPFLCVQAAVRSTRDDSGPSRCMDFMVDSGSDVSTLRDDIIQDLQLEPLGTVNSCGVYGSQRTTMYRAIVTLGDTQFEIEVISSSYDSLGSRVLRYFKHRIDSSRHMWLRGSRPVPPLIGAETPSQQPVSIASSLEQAETVPVMSSAFTAGTLSSAQIAGSVSSAQRAGSVSSVQTAGAVSGGRSVLTSAENAAGMPPEGGNASLSRTISGENTGSSHTTDEADDDGDGFRRVAQNSCPSYQLDHGYVNSMAREGSASINPLVHAAAGTVDNTANGCMDKGARTDTGSYASNASRGTKRNRNGHVTGASSQNNPRSSAARRNTAVFEDFNDGGRKTTEEGTAGLTFGAETVAGSSHGYVICTDSVVRIVNQTAGNGSGDVKHLHATSKDRDSESSV